ncbi:MAG: bL17 family ribosomal protein [Candidatus Shapirobacteria bacterium]|jgi:large subunit ribosomal protein L17|nr:bL17 family ribosomal protein [Candidatus Shapirobacteria bacterium]
MRHRISGYHLGRTTNQRKNLYRSQLRSLFTHGYIKTTVTKAKSIAPLAEKIALSAVKADLNSRRYIFTFFQDRNVVNNIVNAFTTTFSGQTQNFTQMNNVKFRQGDNALIVRLSFVKEVKCISPVISKADKKIASDKIKVSFGGKVKEVRKKVATKKKIVTKKETKK